MNVNAPNRYRQAITLAGLALALTACASSSDSLPSNARACPEQRPEACTMEFRPVIGFDANGESQGEFSNFCAACREDGITHTVRKDNNLGM